MYTHHLNLLHCQRKEHDQYHQIMTLPFQLFLSQVPKIKLTKIMNNIFLTLNHKRLPYWYKQCHVKIGKCCCCCNLTLAPYYDKEFSRNVIEVQLNACFINTIC